ncbi:MAG: hypothetical protein KAI47_20245, partial [Deltaproteobacteria bacterium]|nr:hypothetical protein [Deltaproteobacteria bacterium]
MPSTWKVQTDAAISAAKIQGIAKHLGGAIQALRNTVYTVGAARVQINTIIAASGDDAKKIVATLGRMKRSDTFLRRGAVIYEFVGNNAALPTIKAGRAHLAAAR